MTMKTSNNMIKYFVPGKRLTLSDQFYFGSPVTIVFINKNLWVSEVKGFSSGDLEATKHFCMVNTRLKLA